MNIISKTIVAAAVMLGAAVLPGQAFADNFGDYKSSTLTGKAWEAYNSKDYKGAVVYAQKCIELYAEDAKKMQAGLTDYPTGKPEDVHKYWALNDVATSYYILGMSLAGSGDKEGARQAFDTVIKEYTFGQCWDPQGWFWKPAEAAEKESRNLQ